MKKKPVMVVSNTAWSLWNFRKNLIKLMHEKHGHVALCARSDEFIKNFSETSYRAKWVKDFSRVPASINAFYFFCITVCHIINLRPSHVLSFTHIGNIAAGTARRFVDFKFTANLSGLGRLYVEGQRESYFSSFVAKVINFALSSADIVFVQNEDDERWLRALINERRPVIKRIPGSGTDLMHFKMSDPVSTYERPTRKILMMSRIIEEKGIDWFLEAAKENENLENLEFVLIGAPDKKNNDIFERVNKWHEEGYINYTGHVSDVRAILDDSYCVVLPSRYREGTPKSLIEALAIGKPIVTTNSPGCRDTIDGNGYAVDSYSEFLSSISRVVRSDKQGYVSLCRRSREIAEFKFDERLVLEEYAKSVVT